ITDSNDENQIFARVLFVAVQGGFDMAGLGGFNIQFAMSELGPLRLFISASVPGGILLEPNTSLSINDFAAGGEFFKTLPSIEEPEKLRDPAFNITVTPPDAATWLTGVKNQVLNQFVAIQAHPNLNGFTAAFTSPMLIKGRAKVFSIYTSK